MRDLLDFVYPPVCQVCRQTFESQDDNIWLCPACSATLQILNQPYCPMCRNPLPDPERHCSGCSRPTLLRWVYSLGIYDGHFSHLIKAFKYEGKEELGRMLGDRLGEQLARMPHAARIDVVCAVPIHKKKEVRRGFNQTEIVAAQVAAALQRECLPYLLEQSRRNLDQIGLSVEQRYQNVRGIFACTDPGLIKDKNVLLIDDVTTSGATLNSAAVTLISAGAKSVAAATIAMALEDGLEPHALYALMNEEF